MSDATTLIDRDRNADSPDLCMRFPTASITLGGDEILLQLDWSGQIVKAFANIYGGKHDPVRDTWLAQEGN